MANLPTVTVITDRFGGVGYEWYQSVGAPRGGYTGPGSRESAPAPSAPKPPVKSVPPPSSSPPPPQDVPEVVVSAPRPPTPIDAIYGYGPIETVTIYGARPAPRRAPKPRPRRRAKPKPKPRPRRRPLIRPRIPIAVPALQFMAQVVMQAIKRVPMLGFFVPNSAGEGENEIMYEQILAAQDEREKERNRVSQSLQPFIPSASRLPDAIGPIAEVLVRGTPYSAPRPGPVGAPNFVFDPVGAFESPFVVGANPYPKPISDPTPRTRPRPTPTPNPIALPQPTLQPFPFPLAEPAPRLQPRPGIPRPRLPIEAPIGAPRLTLPNPSPVPSIGPVPQEALDKCNCPKPKKRKPKQPRTECKTGTYTQTAKTILYKPRRKIACR